MTAPNLPGWKVSGVSPETAFAPGVGAVSGFRVQFTTDTGVSGSIFVAETQIRNTSAVHAAIADQVASLHQIHTLQG